MKIENLTQGQVLKNYKELCSVLEVKEKAGNSKKSQLKELDRYVRNHKEGNKFVIDEIYEVAHEKTRSDKGTTRDEYNTIKEQFKPLIYGLVVSKPNNTYTGSFNNWMEYSKITTQAWGYMNRKFNEGQITNKDINDFFRIEGKSLNYMFQSALDSMVNEGSIVKYDVRIAVIDNRDIIEEFGNEDKEIPFNSYKILEGSEKKEIDDIEDELLKGFGVEKLSDLAYGRKSSDKKIKDIPRDLFKLKKFKNEFNSILLKKYGYHMCFRATKVCANDVNEIQEFKEKYGITDDMQKVVAQCKQKIYESRLKKAIDRYEKPITTAIGSWYETDELMKELKDERDNNLCTWNGNYKRHIYNGK